MQPSAGEEMMQRGGGETHKKQQPVPQNIKKREEKQHVKMLCRHQNVSIILIRDVTLPVCHLLTFHPQVFVFFMSPLCVQRPRLTWRHTSQDT